jgi:hypothetical protein
MGSSEHGRVSHSLSAWRKAMTTSMQPISVIGSQDTNTIGYYAKEARDETPETEPHLETASAPIQKNNPDLRHTHGKCSIAVLHLSRLRDNWHVTAMW